MKYTSIEKAVNKRVFFPAKKQESSCFSSGYHIVNNPMQ